MCVCWVSIRKKGWRLYDLDKHEFFVSRDVIFSEEEFPFANTEAATVSVKEFDEEDKLWAPIAVGPIFGG